MEKRHIKPAIEGLKKINQQKLENKSNKAAIFKIFLKLVHEQRKYEEEQEDLRTVFLSAHKEEQNTLIKLQSDFQVETDPVKRKAIYEEMNKHEDFRKANEELSEKIEALGKEQITVEPLDEEKFCEDYQKQDYDLSVIEAILPLFQNNSKK